MGHSFSTSMFCGLSHKSQNEQVRLHPLLINRSIVRSLTGVYLGKNSLSTMAPSLVYRRSFESDLDHDEGEVLIQIQITHQHFAKINAEQTIDFQSELLSQVWLVSRKQHLHSRFNIGKLSPIWYTLRSFMRSDNRFTNSQDIPII